MAGADTTETLILRLAAGERPALGALHAREGARLWALCRRHGGRNAAGAGADEVYEQVWRAIWQAAPDFAATGLGGSDWLVLVAREVILAAYPAPKQDDAARLADLPPALPQQGALAACLARLPPEDAELVVRALLQGEGEAALASRFGVPPARMSRWIDRVLVTVDLCLGGPGGSAAARAVLGLATRADAHALAEAAGGDRQLRASRARWAHAVAGAFAALSPTAPPAAALARVERRLFDDTGGGILRRLGLIPALVAALIGALLLVWISNSDDPPLGEPQPRATSAAPAAEPAG